MNRRKPIEDPPRDVATIAKRQTLSELLLCPTSLSEWVQTGKLYDAKLEVDGSMLNAIVDRMLS